MDSIINKLVKDKISDILEETLVYQSDDTSIRHRWIATTHAAAVAWLWFHQSKQDTIIKAFQQTGISLCPSGNDDYKLHVRGLPNLTVGPWELEIESDEELEFVDNTDPTNYGWLATRPFFSSFFSNFFCVISVLACCTDIKFTWSVISVCASPSTCFVCM